jgi:hypothetical protein
MATVGGPVACGSIQYDWRGFSSPARHVRLSSHMIDCTSSRFAPRPRLPGSAEFHVPVVKDHSFEIFRHCSSSTFIIRPTTSRTLTFRLSTSSTRIHLFLILGIDALLWIQNAFIATLWNFAGPFMAAVNGESSRYSRSAR